MGKKVQEKKSVTKQRQNLAINSKIDTGNVILVICGIVFAFFPDILFYGIGIVLAVILVIQLL